MYRVDFAVDTDDGSGTQRVEQWDYERDPERPARLRGSGTLRAQAFRAEDDTAPTTWWRVVNPASLNGDGHARSYEIVNEGSRDPYRTLTRPEISFTNDHPCQEYASGNLNAGCPNQSVSDYVAAETAPLTDPVAWVSVGYHHIPRDEDQSPMPVHWQSFSLVPRDLLAQQAVTPAERSCDNGLTTGAIGSCAAISAGPPTIAVDRATPASGALLTADTGTWRVTRTTLSYQFLWLRDGAPIFTTGEDGLPTAATGETYRLTDADVGHRITVQVTASAAGVIPGSATSAPLTVPAPSAVLPPSSGAVRIQPKLKLKLKKSRNGRPRLRIVVRGDHGPGEGVVLIRRQGRTIATAVLRGGRVVVRLPRVGKRYRVKVVYPGDQRYLKVTAKARVPRS
ncbi:hypothetical protein [Nocardioides humi]|uniref:copper amine oxidase n=1 Tax=Nocardioides humi TaxID=449461 RepID=UPI002482521D|nr:hypothetical protein [Nocardioides humi]